MSIRGQDYVMEKYGIEKGLNTLHILTVFQASNNFIWVGTDRGVSHFDGSVFTNFTVAEKIVIGSVHDIEEDENGVIWIGSNKGLFYFTDDKVYPTPWKYQNDNEHSIKDLLFNQQGDLWVASGRGPFLITNDQLKSTLKKENRKYYSPTLQAWESSDLCDRRAHCLALDQDNNLWVGNYFTVSKVNGYNLEIFFDTQQIKSSRVSGVIPTSQDSTTISIRYTEVSEKYSDYIHPNCTLFDLTVKIKAYNDLVIGLDGSSLFSVHNKERQTMIVFPSEKITAPKDFMIDHEGHIWVSSESGLSKFTKSNFLDYSDTPSLLNKHIHSTLSLGEDEIIIGGSGGEIFRYNTENKNQLSLLQEYKLNARSFITGMTLDLYKNIWLSLNVEGLAKIDINNEIKYYNHKDGIADNGMSFIIKDKTHNLWAGGDGGVTKINVQDNNSPKFNNYRYESGNDNFIVIKKGVVDNNNRPWFGTSEGLFTISNEELVPVYQTQTKGIHYIYDLIHTKSNDVLLATGQNGIIKCDLDKSGMISNIDHLFDDQYYRDKNFISLFEDEDRHLWAISYSEICKIFEDQTHGQIVRCFNHEDGYPLYDYSKASILQDAKKTMWFSAPNGICSIEPNKNTLNSQEAILFLHDVLIENTNNDHKSENLINPNTDNTFLHNQNYLSFDFSSISFTNTENIRYKHVLEGVDNEWRESTGRHIVRYPQLSAGSYTFKANATNNHGIWNKVPLEYSFVIKPPFWKTIWFYILCSLIIISLISLFVKQKIDQIKKEEAEQYKINNLIAELKIKAIRSQMNPHFIFNCLNSIQACISDQKTTIASTYLSTFAKLLRMVLDYCEQNKISLDKEIEFLSLYLEMEKLRFGSDLEFSIEIADNIDTEEIDMPSFLLQPFVENSIWHGLMHKVGHRKLWLRFTLSQDENLILCEIEDNGIGRKQSQLLKKERQFTLHHQSKGMSLSTERIDLIKMQSDQNISFDIEDLYDNQDHPTGTKIKLLLPLS